MYAGTCIYTYMNKIPCYMRAKKGKGSFQKIKPCIHNMEDKGEERVEGGMERARERESECLRERERERERLRKSE